VRESRLARSTLLFVPLLGCGLVNYDPILDAASDGGTTVALCTDAADVLLCEDFEADISDYAVQTQGANIAELDSTRSRSGTASLHVIGNSEGAAKIIAGSSLPAVTNGSLYVRFYEWIPASVVLAERFTLTHVVSKLDPYPGVIVEAIPGNVARIQSSVDALVGEPGATVLPRDAWYCFQLSLEVSTAGSGSATAYFDGALAATYSGNTAPPEGLTDVHIGIHNGIQPSPIELWIDDVVVDDAPVGCD